MTTDTDETAVRNPAQPRAPIGIDANLFHRLDQLRQTYRRLGSERETTKQERDKVNEQLVEEYAQAGMGVGDDLTLGGRKGTLQGLTWAKKMHDAVTTEQVVAALEASGLGHLVKPASYDSNSLSGYLRELERNGEEIPEPLAEVICGVTRYEITFSKSNRHSAVPPPPAPPDHQSGGESPA